VRAQNFLFLSRLIYQNIIMNRVKVVPYSRGPDEEFPKNPLTLAYKWSSRRQRNYGRAADVDRLLGDVIKTRKDTEEYGFVFNIETGMVFYADREATQFLSENLKTPLKVVANLKPSLVKSIM